MSERGALIFMAIFCAAMFGISAASSCNPDYAGDCARACNPLHVQRVTADECVCAEGR